MGLLAIGLMACHHAKSQSTPPPAGGAPLVGTEWTLVEIDGQPAGLGAGEKPATLSLSEADKHASGFAGCNRMSGTYELAGSTLRFGPMAVTRMACATGMDLETRFLAVLEATRGYRLAAEGLELTGEAGTLARFAHQ
jgi:heat shock protein HslJ